MNHVDAYALTAFALMIAHLVLRVVALIAGRRGDRQVQRLAELAEKVLSPAVILGPPPEGLDKLKIGNGPDMSVVTVFDRAGNIAATMTTPNPGSQDDAACPTK